MSHTIDLSGPWQLALDPRDAGLREEWHRTDRAFTKQVNLPGSLTEQLIGDDVTVHRTPWIGDIQYEHAFFTSPRFERYRTRENIKIPYWLTPVKYFAGPAWYRRQVCVPAAWAGRRVVLHLERPHWETRLYIDGHPVGRGESLAAPHEYDVTDHMTPGEHTITLRIDNRMIVNVGPNSHSVSDHTQGNWNGVVGTVELRSGGSTWLDGIRLLPRAADRSLRVEGRIANRSGLCGGGTLVIEVAGREVSRSPVAWDTQCGWFDVTLRLDPSLPAWDEFTPALHTFTARLLMSDGSVVDERTLRFGFRDLGVDGRKLTINGRPLFLRGTLECCIFPLTGYPPTDPAPWRRIMQIARAHGLNHLRFHSYCPPEAAFAAADEAGMYLQVECSSWPNQGATVGDGSATDQFLHDEAERIVATYGHHPSFCMLAPGNEPAGAKMNDFLSAWVTRWRQLDPLRLHTTGAGWPVLPGSDYHSAWEPRLFHWGDGPNCRILAREPETVTDYTDFVLKHDRPVISHEIGQWCAFPNVEEIAKYTGVFRARNFEIVVDLLRERGLTHLAKPFLLASGKLQTLCYKEDIESALRTPDFGGFQLLDLHDFPGQGTALVGVLDAFWDGKGYVSPEEFRRFCGSTVPLARLTRRTFTAGDSVAARIDVAHFGPDPIRDAKVEWELRLDGKVVRSGTIGPVNIGHGAGLHLGDVAIDTAGLPAPAKYTLVVRIAGTPFENDWALWLYPAADETDAGHRDVRLTSNPREAIALAAEGHKVLLHVPKEAVRSDVAVDFCSIFWNTCWTSNQPPHTLGILCEPNHPAFSRFPTEFHSDWQWWGVVHGSAALELDRLREPLEPLVRLIDDWNTVRSLALAIEARMGRGAILVYTGSTATDSRHSARQMVRSLLAYMGGGSFSPRASLEPADLLRLLEG